MYEVRRVRRTGVEEVDGRLECSVLGIRGRDTGPEALAAGLCSEELVVHLGRCSLSLPPWFTSRARALPGGTIPAALACLRQFGAGMGLLLLLAAGALATGAVTGSLALVALAALGLLLLGSILVHELGHVLAYRILMGAEAPAVLVVRGASCRVLRRAGRPAADAGVVLAGSAAPVAAALLSWPLFPVMPTVVLLGTLIALGHVAGLVLPFGDGAALREIARGRADTV